MGQMTKSSTPVMLACAHAGELFVGLRRYPGGIDQPSHLHEGSSASLLLSGMLREEWDSGAFRAAGFARVYKPSDARHATRIGPGGATLLSVEIEAPGDARAAPIPHWSRPVADEWRDAAVLLSALLGGDHEAHMADAAHDLITGFGHGSVPGDERRAQWLTRLFDRLSEETGEPVPLAELARQIGVNPSYAARAFRSRYGVSPSQHRRRARCLRALDSLVGREASIAAAAADAGFADQSHFTRELRLFLGITPGQLAASERKSNPFKTEVH